MPSEFDKDFGYLMPFLDKIGAAAGTLADPAARAELAKLVSEEKVRWTRIRQLLGGTGGAASSGPASRAAAQSPSKDVPRAPAFTVGSLKK